jgi:hypothetical protein
VHIVLLGFAAGFFAYGFCGRRFVRVGQHFSRKLDVLGTRGRFAMSDCRRWFVTVAVIVVFEIFKNITDVQEGVAVQADIHERRLHAG